ncbi:MAG: dihydrodipicolinate synthase family protein [Bryobacteraceae bacterium]
MAPWTERLRAGCVIPAHPLALNADRKLDERRQRALTRYYLDAGSGGVAVGVHTTQFEIRLPRHGLFRPVLELAAEELKASPNAIRVAGVVGPTKQAAAEAALARDLGYQIVLLSLAALKDASVDALIDHSRAVAEVIPVFGFYLQPAVGGRVLPYEFWRRFVEIENVLAVKVAPFHRYQTLDVVRAVQGAGRPVALYTGNDDNIIGDLLTPPFTGGLLGHWAAWTRSAVQLFERTQRRDYSVLEDAFAVTDMNAAIFDAANHFHGCIAGVHEVLRRQGLLEGRWCLNPAEDLSPGQSDEISRVIRAYPHLTDDEFVRQNLDRWLK